MEIEEKLTEQSPLKRWKSEFLQDYKAHDLWLSQKETWEKFYDGDQLSAEEKTELQKRGQPEVVVNLIAPRVDAIIGDFLKRRVMMRARDRGTGDFEKAKFITEALRYVSDQTRFDEQEAQLAKNLFIGGQGWYKIHLEFDFLEPEIRVSYRDYNDIILDRHCKRPDLKDAKRLYETVWVEMEDLIELFPDFEQQIRSNIETGQDFFQSTQKSKDHLGDGYVFGNSSSAADNYELDTFIDKKRKRIRVTNIWERVKKRIEFAFHPSLNGGTANLSKMKPEEISDFNRLFPTAQRFVRDRWELNSGIFICNQILEQKVNIRPHDSDGKFPFARACAKKDHQTLVPYGVVKQYVDPQREYNKRRSKMLHKLNVNRIIAEAGAVDDPERARVEASRPDGYVETNPGKQFQILNQDAQHADVFMLQLAQNEVESSGVAKEFAGIEAGQLSGKAIQLRLASADKQLTQYYAALRSARRNAFSILLEEIQQYWTSQKLIKITDDQNAGGIILNQRVMDENTGQEIIINDLRLGKYDITIDEDVETPNQRSEQFAGLTQLAQAILSSGQPFPVEMLINASDLPGKQELVQAIMAEKQRQLEIAQAQAIIAAGAAHQKGQKTETPAVNGG